MNVLQRIDRLVQRAVERPFAWLSGSKLQPVEVARALEKEMVSRRRVGIDHVYGPNWFRAELPEEDFAQFEPFLLRLQQEIGEDLIRTAQRRGYVLVGEVTVELLANADLRRGDILALAEVRETPRPVAPPAAAGPRPIRTAMLPTVAPAADGVTLVVRDEQGGEQRVRMDRPEVRVGRGLENDIVLDSLSVSREHARFLRDGWLVVEDLGSRNGTFVNGERVQRAQIAPGDTVRLGTAEVTIEP